MQHKKNLFVDRPSKERAAIAAYWLCQSKGADGKGSYYRQADLPEIFGEELSRSDLSRLAKEAIELGYFSETVIRLLTLPQHMHDWVRSQVTEFTNLEAALRKRFTTLNRVIICQAAPNDPLIDDEAWDHSLQIFGQSAATEILSLAVDGLKNVEKQKRMKIGIGWGRTLASIVGAIAEKPPALSLRQETSDRFEVFPTWGALYRPRSVPTSTYDSLSPQTVGASSSAIAAVLQKALTGGGETTPSIHGLPAIIPKKWDQGDDKKFFTRRTQFLRDLSDFTSYAEIFGLPSVSGKKSDNTLIETMDCALVTVGAASHPTRFYHGDSFSHYFGSGSLEEKQFLKYCIGDIGGVLLASGKPGRSQEADEFVSRISKYFVCTQRSHLRKLADKAAVNPALLGVIAAVHGSVRLEATERALGEGLINTLCICPHLAQAFSKQMRLT